jgi:hypothetical protein
MFSRRKAHVKVCRIQQKTHPAIGPRVGFGVLLQSLDLPCRTHPHTRTAPQQQQRHMQQVIAERFVVKVIVSLA